MAQATAVELAYWGSNDPYLIHLREKCELVRTKAKRINLTELRALLLEGFDFCLACWPDAKE